MADGGKAPPKGEADRGAGGFAGLLPYAALTTTAFLWSGNWVTGRWLQGAVPPIAISFWRWLIAMAILLPFTAVPLWRERAAIRREWRRLVVFGVIAVSVFNALVYFGLETTTAINGSLVNSAAPIFVIIISWFGVGDSSTWRQGAGVAISLTGVTTILARGDPAAVLALRFGVGDLVITAAIFIWAVYTTLLRHWPTELRPLTFVAATIVIGMIFLTPAYLIERQFTGDFEVTPQTLVGIGYLGTFASVGAYICWNFGVRAVGAGKATLFQHLVPAFAAVLAMILLDERLRLFHVAGIALILSGIYIATAARPFWRR